MELKNIPKNVEKDDYLGKSFETEKGLFTIDVIITYSNKPLEMLIKDENNQAYFAEADDKDLNNEKMVYELRKITSEYYQKLYNWILNGIPFKEESDKAIEYKPTYRIYSYLGLKNFPDKIMEL